MVTRRPVCPDCGVVVDVTVNGNDVSVAGGDPVFSADDISVSGSAHSGCPLHQSPRTSARALPAGADPERRDPRTWIFHRRFAFQGNFEKGSKVMTEVFVLQKVERSRPQSQEDLTGVLEGVRALEALVQAAEEMHRQFHHR